MPILQAKCPSQGDYRYEKQRDDFMLSNGWKKFFGDGETFQQAVEVHNFMSKGDIEEAWLNLGEAEFDCLFKGLSTNAFVRNQKLLINVCAKYTDAYSDDVVLDILAQASRFIYPPNKLAPSLLRTHGGYM